MKVGIVGRRLPIVQSGYALRRGVKYRSRMSQTRVYRGYYQCLGAKKTEVTIDTGYKFDNDQ